MKNIWLPNAISYDVSWRTVHELLFSAANALNELMPDKKPFVLQTNLDDFYVSHQLKVFTDNAAKKTSIYSELH